MQYKLGQIGLVLGAILIIMGLATSNIGELVLGVILLGLGIYDYYQKGKQDSGSRDQ